LRFFKARETLAVSQAKTLVDVAEKFAVMLTNGMAQETILERFRHFKRILKKLPAPFGFSLGITCGQPLRRVDVLAPKGERIGPSLPRAR